MNDFFKKIEEIGSGEVKRNPVFAKGSPRPLKKISKWAVQLLLDKAGELIYLHKIFQHISVGVVGERRPGRKPANRHMTWAE